MKRFNWTVFLFAAVLSASCRKPNNQQYQAPRDLGESVLSWADALSSTGSRDCLDGQMECSRFYLGTKEHWLALPAAATNLYEYVALVDFDYDTELVSIFPDRPLDRHILLKVRSILGEYVNLIPGKKWENIVLDAKCDEKGHCFVYSGGYPMPLWSGVSVLFSRVRCPTQDYPKYNVYVMEAYAVEDGKIYDFFGFGYDWNEMREMLIQAGEASSARPEACSPKPAIPPPPPSNEGPSEDVIIAPLPDAGQ